MVLVDAVGGCDASKGAWPARARPLSRLNWPTPSCT